jgi:choline dehydrogenase
VQKNPINNAFMNAVVEAGYTSTEDYNGYRQEGFSAGDMTVWQGRRWSSANAYLKPALQNKNLTLFKNALVDKIIISEKTAKGVSFFQGRKLKKIYANRELFAVLAVLTHLRSCSDQALAQLRF